MSRACTKEKLNAASEMMKQRGHMGLEECRRAIEQQPVSFDLRKKGRKEPVKAMRVYGGQKPWICCFFL